MAKVKKEKQPATQYWQKLVDTFYVFYEKNFEGEKPSFDGSAPRDLKGIVEALKKRADDAGVGWSEEIATCRLQKFFEAAFKVDWLRENFLLFNLNRQKDKVFLTIKRISNGESITSQKPSNGNNYKTAGQDAYAERLKRQLSEINRG